MKFREDNADDYDVEVQGKRGPPALDPVAYSRRIRFGILATVVGLGSGRWCGPRSH
jgi:hypothetical protein